MVKEMNLNEMRLIDAKYAQRYADETLGQEDARIVRYVLSHTPTVTLGEWEGKTIGICLNCANAKEDFRESREGWLNCPMWGAAGINPNGFCHMWKQKEE